MLVPEVQSLQRYSGPAAVGHRVSYLAVRRSRPAGRVRLRVGVLSTRAQAADAELARRAEGGVPGTDGRVRVRERGAGREDGREAVLERGVRRPARGDGVLESAALSGPERRPVLRIC